MTRYWIGVASRDHVRKAVEGGFCQFSHGSDADVRRVQPGDGVVYYSPREQMRGGQPVQAFTAIGIVAEGEPERPSGDGGFRPSRRPVNYAKATDAPIRPLLDQLSFTQGKTHWGQTFRRGLLPVEAGDFKLIAKAMDAMDVIKIRSIPPSGAQADRVLL